MDKKFYLDLLVAALWMLTTLGLAYQWYWQGRRDQRLKDSQLLEEFKDKVIQIIDSNTDPRRPAAPKIPDYINHQ